MKARHLSAAGVGALTHDGRPCAQRAWAQKWARKMGPSGPMSQPGTPLGNSVLKWRHERSLGNTLHACTPVA